MSQPAFAADINGTATNNSEKKSRVAQRLFRSSAKDALPLTIQHERIYILPSSRGMAFICVIAIMLMASINYGLNLGYALCFILIGLFASCLLATYKNLVNIKFISINSSDTFADSELIYTVRISEEAKRHRSSISLNNAEATAIFDIKALEITEATLTVSDATRGIHHLGRLTVSSDFPLGLWRGWGYLHTPAHSHIYPTPERPSADFKSNSANTAEPLVKHVGEQEFSGLKTYENTDSPSRVAWKRVASGAGWYTKQFEAEAEQREISIRWQDTPAHLDTEQRLSRMCGWILRAKGENIAHTFELPGYKSLDLASGQEHYETCLRALATYNSAAHELANYESATDEREQPGHNNNSRGS